MVVAPPVSTKAAAANLVATAVLPGSIKTVGHKLAANIALQGSINAPLDRQDVDAVDQVCVLSSSLKIQP